MAHANYIFENYKDITTIAVILYWYVDGYEIIESGMTTQTIEF